MINVNENKDYKKELLSNGFISFVPSGNSMWPILRGGKTTVIIEKKQFDERLKLYDVGFFVREDGQYVLHRVVGINDSGYDFRGDGTDYIEFAKEDAVIGIMAGFYKGKKLIKVTDKSYVKKYTKWYKKEKRRRFLLKLFHINNAIKRKLFKRTKIKED